MPRLVLSFPHGLPGDSVPSGLVLDPARGVAWVDLVASDLPALVATVVTLARALPQAEFAVELSPAEAALVPSTPAAAPDAAATPQGAWALLDAGQLAAAVAAFAVEGLDSAGRERARALAASTDPAQVALACQIAAAANWRSFVTPMRRMLEHADTRVRTEAVRAIGVLAGPSMLAGLQRLASDPSPDVRAAVTQAMATIEGDQG